MKITTWNVNGIRAVIGKGLWDWALQNNADVLCLQEVKARPEQLADGDRSLDGYVDYWNPAVRPGYSGVASYCKKEPLSIQYGLGDERFDDEGRVIRMEFPEFILFNIYFPNGQRGHDRVEYKLNFYEALLNQCDQLHALGKKIIITGDFNTAHNEIDLANPKENVNTSGFMPEERVWIDYFLQHGFVDAYRQLYPERVQYTWWTYRFGARRRNIGWRLDYFLVSDSIMEMVEDVIVYDEVMGSDHCPVTISLKF